jgi:hypothetical protein
MSDANLFPDLFMSQSQDDWNPFEYLRTLDANTAQADTPCPPPATLIQSPKGTVDEIGPSRQLRADEITLLHLAEWDPENAYDEDPPRYIHYSIEWKVTVNRKVVSRDIEQDLVLAPGSYWDLFLRPKLEKLLRKKLSHSKCVRPDDITVAISVTERSERDLIKRFDDIEVNWSIVEKQLTSWGELFRAGKKLRVDLLFNYLEVGQQPAASSKRGDKRGSSSASQQMFTERAAQLDAEQDAAGQPSVWREVYSLMRCPGPPCHLGPYCWCDPVGKKHYK